MVTYLTHSLNTLLVRWPLKRVLIKHLLWTRHENQFVQIWTLTWRWRNCRIKPLLYYTLPLCRYILGPFRRIFSAGDRVIDCSCFLITLPDISSTHMPNFVSCYLFAHSWRRPYRTYGYSQQKMPANRYKFFLMLLLWVVDGSSMTTAGMLQLPLRTYCCMMSQW